MRRRAPRRPKLSRRKNPSYEATHWGRAPEDVHTALVSEPGDNEKLIGLGVVHSIVYVTRKGGDAEDVEYEHTFNANDPPLLAYGSDDNRLYFVGGGYKVTPHGIEK